MKDMNPYLRYASINFEAAVAHGGSAPILFKRLVDRSVSDWSVNFIDASIVPVGADIGVHTHSDDNEEIYVVLSGRGLMFVDGKEFEVSEGDVIMNRPGGTHGLRNIGNIEMRLIVIEIPVRPGE